MDNGWMTLSSCPDGTGFGPLLRRSLMPALMFDDQRRCRDANTAACLLFRLSRARVLELRVEDMTPPENLPALQTLWQDFLSHGTQAGIYELMLPDGQRLRAAYSAIANVSSGLHIALLDPQPDWRPRDDELTPGDEKLSAREREVLALVAVGETGPTIARDLHISIATVETHIRHCLAKLGARNRTHAVLLALKRGEISLI